MKRLIAFIASLAIGLLSLPTVSTAAPAKFELAGRIYFADSSAALDAVARKSIKTIYREVSVSSELRLIGFVQSGNGEANNSSLSKQRAKSVKRFLTNLGFEGRIAVVGKGLAKSDPWSAKSRRVGVWASNQSQIVRDAAIEFDNVVYNYCSNEEDSGPISAQLKNGSEVIGTYDFECAEGDATSALWADLPEGDYQLEITFESYWYCEYTWVTSPWSVEECGGNPFNITLSTAVSLVNGQTTEVELLVVPYD